MADTGTRVRLPSQHLPEGSPTEATTQMRPIGGASPVETTGRQPRFRGAAASAVTPTTAPGATTPTATAPDDGGTGDPRGTGDRAAPWPPRLVEPAWGSNWDVDTRTMPRMPRDPLDGPTEVIWRPIGAATDGAGPSDTGSRRSAAPRSAAPGGWATGSGGGVGVLDGSPAAPAVAEGRAAVRRRERRRQLMEWPVLVVFSLLAALVLRTFVIQTFYIPSESMHDTLLEGDRVLVNKLSYRFHDVHRGDVIVFQRPANINIPDKDLIKRVVGLPGDVIEGRGGKVYINGRLLLEPYIQRKCLPDGTLNLKRTVVPSHHLFVMGDNRCDSTDSRVFGPIDESLVVGRAFVRAWPPSRIGWL